MWCTLRTLHTQNAAHHCALHHCTPPVHLTPAPLNLRLTPWAQSPAPSFYGSDTSHRAAKEAAPPLPVQALFGLAHFLCPPCALGTGLSTHKQQSHTVVGGARTRGCRSHLTRLHCSLSRARRLLLNRAQWPDRPGCSATPWHRLWRRLTWGPWHRRSAVRVPEAADAHKAPVATKKVSVGVPLPHSGSLHFEQHRKSSGCRRPEALEASAASAFCSRSMKNLV